MHDEPLDPLKITVWYWQWESDVPLFFKDANGWTVTVTDELYEQVLGFFLPQVAEFEFSRIVDYNRTKQPSSQLGQRWRFAIQPPDLMAPDFFVWSFFKFRIYHNKPRTLQVLKANIVEEIANLMSDVLIFSNVCHQFCTFK